MKTLTAKQDRFCQEIVIGQTLSDAYDMAFQPRKASKKSINERASRLRKNSKIVARIRQLQAPVVAQVQRTMTDRLNELTHAIFLDPADCFDDLGQFLPIRAMPEHVRRAIASYEVDPVSLATKIKFVDKLAAITQYSKLVGDIPKGKGPVTPLPRSRFDLSKLTDEELKEHMRLRRKTLIEAEEPDSCKNSVQPLMRF